MKRIKDYKQFLLEKFADKYPKRAWIDISGTREDFADVISSLINNAYKHVPGGTIEDPKTTIEDPAVDFWVANDLDEDPDCDAIIYGKHTTYGVKLTGMGQDGGREAKVETIKSLQKNLGSEGFYTEISENVLSLLSKDIPYVNNQEDVEKIIKKKIEWVGKADGLEKDGWYYRNIGGHRKLKLLVGNPKGISKDALSEAEEVPALITEIENDISTFVPTQIEKSWEHPSEMIKINKYQSNWHPSLSYRNGKWYVEAEFRDLGKWELEYDDTNRWKQGEKEKYEKEFHAWAKKFDWYDKVILELDIQDEYEMTKFRIILK